MTFGKSQVHLWIDEEELSNLLEDREKAKKKAEEEGFEGGYIFKAEAEIEEFSIDDNGEALITVTSKYGNLGFDNIELGFGNLLDVVNHIHKKLGKAKTVMEGLK